MKTVLWLPRNWALESTPVAALGFTDCAGLVCEAWLPELRLVPLPEPLPMPAPCVLPVFCDAPVDWFVVACESMKMVLWLPRNCAFASTPVAALGFTDCDGLVCEAWLPDVD